MGTKKHDRIDVDILIDGGEIGAFYNSGSSATFEGPYDCTPTFEDIVLPTENKWMTGDMVFRAIPVLEVSNPQGGITVTIGG